MKIIFDGAKEILDWLHEMDGHGLLITNEEVLRDSLNGLVEALEESASEVLIVEVDLSVLKSNRQVARRPGVFERNVESVLHETAHMVSCAPGPLGIGDKGVIRSEEDDVAGRWEIVSKVVSG